MPKTIREIYTDISGNVSVEYSDNSVRNFSVADTAVKTTGIPVSASREITSSDLDQVLDVSSAATLTIPTDAILGIEATDRVAVGAYQMSAGAVAWTNGAGGTSLRGTAPTAAQYTFTGLLHVGANEWVYIQ